VVNLHAELDDAARRTYHLLHRAGIEIHSAHHHHVVASPENAAFQRHLLTTARAAHFLGSPHTLANFENAFWRSELSNNDSFEQWEIDGGLDAAQRANAIWKRMLNEYEAPPIDPGLDEALQEFIAKRKASMTDSEV